MRSLADGFTLSNGVKIPCIGYGTWKTSDGSDTCQGVKMALLSGYRHIDTATIYGNEASVGIAMKESGLPRRELFVTTKQWVNMRGYEKTLEACDKALKRLGIDYLDLYLVHWPCVERFRKDWKEVNAETWRGFERLYQEGKVRAIGVSNYQEKHLEALLEYAAIPPMVNQVEFHPGYTQEGDVRYSQGQGILPEAWSPLGNGQLLSNETLLRIGKAHQKTAAQVCIRFCLQMGVLPLTKSLKGERIRDNVDVFDFELSEEDMKEIRGIPQACFSGLMPEDAPHDVVPLHSNF